MEVCSKKLKPLKATLRQQLTFDFLKVFGKINGKSYSFRQQKNALVWALFFDGKI